MGVGGRMNLTVENLDYFYTIEMCYSCYDKITLTLSNRSKCYYMFKYISDLSVNGLNINFTNNINSDKINILCASELGLNELHDVLKIIEKNTCINSKN